MDLTSLHRFHVAPGYDPAAPETWVWEDRSADVNHTTGGVTTTGGRGDEVSQVEPGKADLEVDNAGGHYCTANPYGRWYGRLARNCPARWGVISGAEAWTANTSNGWGTPDVGTSWSLDGSASDWSSSGGLGQVVMAAANTFRQAELVGGNARNGEATFVCSAPVVATGAALVYSFAARRTVGVSQILFSIDFGTGGVLGARIKRNIGAALTDIGGTPTVGTYSAGQRIKARCVWDGQDLRLRVWPEASTEPTTWSATAVDSQCTGSAVAVHSWRVSGNSNAGSLTYSYDDLEVEAVEIVGTVPAWPVRWDPTAVVSYAPIQISGIIRRLGQGQQALRSPIYRQLSAQPGCGYWPLEDGSDANVGSTQIPRGIAARVADGSFGSADCPPGAMSALTLNTAVASRVFGRVVRWTVAQDGFAAMFYFKLGSLPGAQTTLFEVSARGTVAMWRISITPTAFQIDGFDADGTNILAPAAASFSADPLEWMAIQLEAQESGGTVNYALIWHQVGSTSFFARSGSFAGTADLIYTVTVIAPTAGALISHLWAGDDLLPFVDSTFQLVSAGYAGELAADRIARLCAEEGVPVTVEAGDSEPLGPQRTSGLLELLRTAEKADMGVLYESGASLAYRPRYARYNRAADFTAAISAAGDVADEPEPTDDDQLVRNEWTVSRDAGGQAVDSDPAHIAAQGHYPDNATVNVQFDGRLIHHASWRVHLGTWGEYRWPQIVLDLTDRPALLASWLGRRHAPRVTVTGVPSQGPIGVDPDLVVEGWSQEITSHSWRVTLNCSPAKPWDVGVYGTTPYGATTTTLVGSLTTTGTSVKIGTTHPRQVWSTSATPTVTFGGEVAAVTSMGAVTDDATLTANGFESGVAGWSTSSCALTQSSTFAHSGTFSGLLTVTGSPTEANIRKALSQSPRIIPGAEYTFVAWVRSAATITAACHIDWVDENGVFVSRDGTSGSLAAGSWVQRSVTATAPAGTAYAQYGVTISGSPAAGTLLYADDMLLTATSIKYQTVTLTRSVNAIVKAHTAGTAFALAEPGVYAL